MARAFPATELPQRIQQLLEERQQHATAIARIDQMLGGVGAALAGTTGTKPSDASASKSRSGPAEATDSAPKGKRRRRRRRNKRGTTAEESILAFVKQQKNPTTAEIDEHYVGEGRGGRSIGVLSRMFKAGKLKRTPLPKGRGSRYSLP